MRAELIFDLIGGFAWLTGSIFVFCCINILKIGPVLFIIGSVCLIIAALIRMEKEGTKKI